MLTIEPRPWASMWIGAVLVDEEGALQVDVDHPVPLVGVEQVDRTAAGHPGAVDHRRRGGRAVRPRRRRRRCDRRLVPHVEHVVDALGDVDGGHRGPFGRQPLDAGGTDARCRPGHHGDGAVESSHRRPPSVVRRRIACVGSNLGCAGRAGQGRAGPAVQPGRPGQSVGQGDEHVLADVADQVDQVAPLGEAPRPVPADEPVVVAPGQDRLEGQARARPGARSSRTGPRPCPASSSMSRMRLVVTCLVPGVPSG